MTETHRYVNKSFKGFGRWKQCVKCGATIHSNYFWLGGYKSKIEPSCDSGFIEWSKNATRLKDGDLL